MWKQVDSNLIINQKKGMGEFSIDSFSKKLIKKK